MEENHTYQLEKYIGRSSRHECPQCHDKNSFALYIDEMGNVLDKSVGRCNHESGCGYHYTPKQYFSDHYTDKLPKTIYYNRLEKQPRQEPNKFNLVTSSSSTLVGKQPEQEPNLDYINKEYLLKSLSYKSDFIKFLCGIFDTDIISRLMSDYAFGATREGSVIFWQVDYQKKIRTGKVIRYDAETGHRNHEQGGINWIHSLMKKNGMLSDNFNLNQCLFGEHLLSREKDKPVALVESEKNAVIGSGFIPSYIWVSTGGKSQLSTDKLQVLRDRVVVMFPDADGFQLWSEKAKELRTICQRVEVFPILSYCDADSKRDIADILLESVSVPQQESILDRMIKKNPTVQLLIDRFNLTQTS